MREHTSGPDLESEKSFQASLLGLIGLGIKLYYECSDGFETGVCSAETGRCNGLAFG